MTYEVAVGLLADTEDGATLCSFLKANMRRATANGFEPVDVPPGRGARMALEAEDREAETVSVKVGRTSSELLIDRTVRWVGGFWPMEFSFFAVVDDGEYAEMRSAAPLDAQVAELGYQVEDWTHSQPAIERVRQQIPADRLLGFLSRAERYAEARQIGALTAFIAMFITTLFSIASGSMLYSRLFTELQEDQAKYLALRRLGLSRREMSEVLTRQIISLLRAVHRGDRALSYGVQSPLQRFGRTHLAVRGLGSRHLFHPAGGLLPDHSLGVRERGYSGAVTILVIVAKRCLAGYNVGVGVRRLMKGGRGMSKGQITDLLLHRHVIAHVRGRHQGVTMPFSTLSGRP